MLALAIVLLALVVLLVVVAYVGSSDEIVIEFLNVTITTSVGGVFVGGVIAGLVALASLVALRRSLRGRWERYKEVKELRRRAESATPAPVAETTTPAPVAETAASAPVAEAGASTGDVSELAKPGRAPDGEAGAGAEDADAEGGDSAGSDAGDSDATARATTDSDTDANADPPRS